MVVILVSVVNIHIHYVKDKKSITEMFILKFMNNYTKNEHLTYTVLQQIFQRSMDIAQVQIDQIFHVKDMFP